jgi:hypothetical protein
MPIPNGRSINVIATLESRYYLIEKKQLIKAEE